MNIPKSPSLRRSEDKKTQPAPASVGRPARVYSPDQAIKIKALKTYNDFVAILQFRIESQYVELTGHKSEGIVVGVGPGLPGSDGKRVPSQLEVGDVVSFYGNPMSVIEPVAGIYAEERIVIIPERAILCQLPSVKFERVDNKPVPNE